MGLMDVSQWREIVKLSQEYHKARASALYNEQNMDVLWKIITAADALERVIKIVDIAVDPPPF